MGLTGGPVRGPETVSRGGDLECSSLHFWAIGDPWVVGWLVVDPSLGAWPGEELEAFCPWFSDISVTPGLII